MLKSRWYQLVSLASVAAVLGSGCGDQDQRASTKDANASDRSSSSSAAKQSADEEAAIRSVAKRLFEFGPGFVPAERLIEDRSGAPAAFARMTKLPIQKVAWKLKSVDIHERNDGLANADISIVSDAQPVPPAAGEADLGIVEMIVGQLRAIRFRDVVFSRVDGTWKLSAYSACAIVYEAQIAGPKALKPCSSEPIPSKGFDSGPTETFTPVSDLELAVRGDLWAVRRSGTLPDTGLWEVVNLAAKDAKPVVRRSEALILRTAVDGQAIAVDAQGQTVGGPSVRSAFRLSLPPSSPDFEFLVTSIGDLAAIDLERGVSFDTELDTSDGGSGGTSLLVERSLGDGAVRRSWELGEDPGRGQRGGARIGVASVDSDRVVVADSSRDLIITIPLDDSGSEPTVSALVRLKEPTRGECVSGTHHYAVVAREGTPGEQIIARYDRETLTERASRKVEGNVELGCGEHQLWYTSTFAGSVYDGLNADGANSMVLPASRQVRLTQIDPENLSDLSVHRIFVPMNAIATIQMDGDVPYLDIGSEIIRFVD